MPLALAEKSMFIVSTEKLRIGRLNGFRRSNCQCFSVVGVVLTAILPVLAEMLADFYPQLRRHRYVAAVKQGVDVRPKQKAVGNPMWTVGCIWLDVCCLQDWKCLLSRHRATTGIGICNQHSKSALA